MAIFTIHVLVLSPFPQNLRERLRSPYTSASDDCSTNLVTSPSQKRAASAQLPLAAPYKSQSFGPINLIKISVCTHVFPALNQYKFKSKTQR